MFENRITRGADPAPEQVARTALQLLFATPGDIENTREWDHFVKRATTISRLLMTAVAGAVFVCMLLLHAAPILFTLILALVMLWQALHTLLVSGYRERRRTRERRERQARAEQRRRVAELEAAIGLDVPLDADHPCIHCGKPTVLGAKRCAYCGKRLESDVVKPRTCEECGTRIPSDASYCPECGRYHLPESGEIIQRAKANAAAARYNAARSNPYPADPDFADIITKGAQTANGANSTNSTRGPRGTGVSSHAGERRGL